MMVKLEVRGEVQSEITHFKLRIEDALILATSCVTVIIGPPHSGKSLIAQTLANKCARQILPSSLCNIVRPRVVDNLTLSTQNMPVFSYCLIDDPRVRALTTYLRWPYLDPGFLAPVYAERYAKLFDEFLNRLRQVSSDTWYVALESVRDVCGGRSLSECIGEYWQRVWDVITKKSLEEGSEVLSLHPQLIRDLVSLYYENIISENRREDFTRFLDRVVESFYRFCSKIVDEISEVLCPDVCKRDIKQQLDMMRLLPNVLTEQLRRLSQHEVSHEVPPGQLLPHIFDMIEIISLAYSARYLEPPVLVVVEDPETNGHPIANLLLGYTLAQLVVDNTDISMLITTSSVDVVVGLLMSVYERGKLDSSVLLYYTEPIGSINEAKLRKYYLSRLSEEWMPYLGTSSLLTAEISHVIAQGFKHVSRT